MYFGTPHVFVYTMDVLCRRPGLRKIKVPRFGVHAVCVRIRRVHFHLSFATLGNTDCFLRHAIDPVPARRIFWLVGGVVLPWGCISHGIKFISLGNHFRAKRIPIRWCKFIIKNIATRAHPIDYLLFVAYGPALQRTGLIGYGTEKCGTFPRMFRVPIKFVELIAVDNAFLLLTLRFGYLGCFFFAAMSGTALWSFLKCCMATETRRSHVAGGYGCHDCCHDYRLANSVDAV